MAWRRSGDKPLSEPMMVTLMTHIYASPALNELTAHRQVLQGVKEPGHQQPLICFHC